MRLAAIYGSYVATMELARRGMAQMGFEEDARNFNYHDYGPGFDEGRYL